MNKIMILIKRNYKRNQKEIMKLKSTIAKMKIILEGFKSRLERAED